MIGFVRQLLVDHVLAPQATVDDEERRAMLSADDAELGVVAQELDVLSLTTVPVSFEIGGGMTLRHTIDVALVVQHGDPAEAVRLRDLIVLDLCLRAVDEADEIMSAVDDTTGQYVTEAGWQVDYRLLPEFPVDTPNETATITFTIETQLDR